MGEIPVPQQEPQTDEFQILPVVSRYAVTHKGQTNFVVLAMPAIAGIIRAQGKSLIHFGEGEILVPSFIPAKPAESPEIRGKLLFEIDAEAILHSPQLARGYDLGSRRVSRQEQIHSFPIVAHIRGVHVRQEPNLGRLLCANLEVYL